MKTKTMVGLVVSGVIVITIIVLIAGFISNNMSFHDKELRKIDKAGFTEKTVSLPDGTVINYGEGGSGTPLLLIHGQGAAWTDYAEVLPKLADIFHVYVVDCHGHGKSAHNPDKYSAKKMGLDFAWFIVNVIGERPVVSGHSSGGLLTAWLAANRPDLVAGIVLEDPPFFSSEKEHERMSFAWNDSFKTAHNFLEQESSDDYTLYYLENSMWIGYFGEGGEGILKSAKDYRVNHDGPLKIFYLPPSLTRPFLFLDDYDPRFGDSFYDFSWFRDFDHRETLSRINCPAVLIHNNWSVDENGILLGAMSNEFAETAARLIGDCSLVRLDSGHNSHAEKPGDFISIMTAFADRLDKEEGSKHEL